MTIRGLSYPTKTEATKASADMAAALGYPKPGRDIGGGIHAPPEQSATLRPYDIIEAIDGTFVVPTDSEIEKALAVADVAKVRDVEIKPAAVVPKIAAASATEEPIP